MAVRHASAFSSGLFWQGSGAESAFIGWSGFTAQNHLGATRDMKADHVNGGEQFEGLCQRQQSRSIASKIAPNQRLSPPGRLTRECRAEALEREAGISHIKPAGCPIGVWQLSYLAGKTGRKLQHRSMEDEHAQL